MIIKRLRNSIFLNQLSGSGSSKVLPLHRLRLRNTDFYHTKKTWNIVPVGISYSDQFSVPVPFSVTQNPFPFLYRIRIRMSSYFYGSESCSSFNNPT
jgi:hypothetical protein